MNATMTRSIREARRRAALARDIVAANSGPWKTLTGWTRTSPEIVLPVAFIAGVLIGRAVASRI